MTKRTYEDLKNRLQEVPGWSEYDAWFDEVCRRVEAHGVSEKDASGIVLQVLTSGELNNLKTVRINTETGHVDLDVANVFSKEGF